MSFVEASSHSVLYPWEATTLAAAAWPKLDLLPAFSRPEEGSMFRPIMISSRSISISRSDSSTGHWAWDCEDNMESLFSGVLLVDDWGSVKTSMRGE